jgi:hypothetical protein
MDLFDFDGRADGRKRKSLSLRNPFYYVGIMGITGTPIAGFQFVDSGQLRRFHYFLITDREHRRKTYRRS